MSRGTTKLDRLFPGKGRLCCAFLLPVILFLILCACIGIVPFGEENLFIQDMHNQYSDYLSYLSSIVRGENDFIYTFSKALGGDMIGFSAYYLLSPFNLLFVLFDNRDYSLCLTLAIALKLGTAGLTAAIFLGQTRKKSRASLIFSTAYALCGYCLIYASNIMWLDGVIALPLVALGIHRLLEKKKPLVYILALAYGLITNYYIGYMLCIFSVLYFLLRLLAEPRRWDKAFGWDVLRFALSSLMAGALSAFVLLPTFLSLEGTKAGFTPELFTLTANFSLPAFAERLFAGSLDYNDLQFGLPNVFCGTVTALALPLFFLNKDVSRREKWLSGGLLLLLFLSMWVNAVNLIWHGFNPPVWFPYRYSFIVSFFVLSCACRALERPEEIRWGRWGVAGSAVLWLALLALAAFGGAELSFGRVALNAGLLVAGTAGLLWLQKKKSVRGALLLLALVQLASLAAEGLGMERMLLHSASSYADYEALEMNDTRHHTAADYEEFIVQTGAMVDYVKEADGGFYRMEKSYSRTANDALQFAYNGLSHFSSTHKTSTKGLLRDYGYFATGFADYYGKGSTMAMDSFLGVKYLITDERSCERPYEPFGASDRLAVFRNPRALPLCFAVSERALAAPGECDNVFERQNRIFEAAAGVSPVYELRTDTVIRYTNIEALETGEMLRMERLDPEAAATAVFSFVASDDGLVYASFSSPSSREAELWLNGERLGDMAQYFQGDVFCLGSFAAGETVELSIRLNDDSLTINQWVIASESGEAVTALWEALCPEEGESLERLSSSRLHWQGRLDEGQGALLLTVPYEANWKAWVDGVETETSPALGGLTAVSVGAGEHSVELRYVPRGGTAGLWLSGAAVLLLVLGLARAAFLKKQRK